MAKLNKMLSNMVANTSKAVATSSANKICYCWVYQPVLPEAVKKLRKF